MNEYGSITAIIAAIFAVIFLFFQTYTMKFGAPWVPTPYKIIRKMLKLAGIKPGDIVYDLGSGDGRMIIEAARSFGATAVGIEIDPLRFLWTKAKIFFLGLSNKVDVLFGNFFKINIRDANIVTIYLLPDTNVKLIDKFVKELRPGTRIVSNTFALPGFKMIDQDEKLKIYVYIV
ncbi:MAG: class I SAM-dependent methyltransferase [Actinomycetia bacterium]|nr:class I SAM-dependent methyltransferase [Actinomycetes bacterium]